MRTGPPPITLQNIRAVLTKYHNNIFARMDTFYFDWLIRQVVTETIVLAFWL